MKPSFPNGIPLRVRDDGIPNRWQDMRAWIIASDGRRDFVGCPDPDYPAAGGAPGHMLTLRPAYEMHDDDVWVSPSLPPGAPPGTVAPKAIAARRRNLVPLHCTASGYEVSIVPTHLFRLAQLTDADLEFLFLGWIAGAESLREAFRQSIANGVNRVQIAPPHTKLPPFRAG